MRERYLQELHIVIESAEEEIRARGRLLAEQMTRQGLEAVVTDADDIGAERVNQKAVLFLTDSSRLVCELQQAQAPVMAWFHEGNRERSFGQVRYAVEAPEELDASFFEQIYRRCKGIPWLIAETARCLIRETIPEDAAAFAEIYRDPEITRYTEEFCAEAETEQETIREYMQKYYEFYGFGVWTVLWKESGEVIGRVGFERPEAPALGYMIARQWQGRGLATECCQAVLRMAEEELGFSEVWAQIHRDNTASVRVAEKLSFVQVREGTEDGESRNLVLNFRRQFAIVEKEVRG